MLKIDREEYVKIKDRFMAKTKAENLCLIWTGALNEWGYGIFGFLGKTSLSHRVSYQLFVGSIPKGFTVDHICRVLACVNPNHLRIMTNRENAVLGSRHRFSRDHCIRGHKYTNEKYAIYKGWRVCLVCQKERYIKRRDRINGIKLVEAFGKETK